MGVFSKNLIKTIFCVVKIELEPVSVGDNVSACRFWHMVCRYVGGDLCHAVT